MFLIGFGLYVVCSSYPRAKHLFFYWIALGVCMWFETPIKVLLRDYFHSFNVFFIVVGLSVFVNVVSDTHTQNKNLCEQFDEGIGKAERVAANILRKRVHYLSDKPQLLLNEFQTFPRLLCLCVFVCVCV